MSYWSRFGYVLGDFGARQVHFKSIIGTPKIAYRYNCIIRVLRIQRVFYHIEPHK
jgi:hypothetical protein